MSLREKFNEKVKEYGNYIGLGNFLTQDISSNSKPLALAGVVALGISATGCQAMEINYYKAPENASFLTKSPTRSMLLMEEYLPTTYGKSVQSLGDKSKRIPANLMADVDAITGIFGVEFFDGSFFGNKLYGGAFNKEDKIAWNYNEDLMRIRWDNYAASKQKNKEGPVNLFDKVVLYIPFSVWNLSSNGFRTARNVYEIPLQTVNMGAILPLTANTHARDVIRNVKSDSNPENDCAKLWFDGVTDVKQPVRGVLTVVGVVMDFSRYGGDYRQQEKLNEDYTNRIDNQLKPKGDLAK